MRRLLVVVAGCALSCAEPQAQSAPSSAPVTPVASVTSAPVANEPAQDLPLPRTAHPITIENESGQARFAYIARTAIDPRLAREAALQRYALVVIIQLEVDGADLRVRLTAKVRDAASGRLAGEIPVSLKLEGGAVDKGGPAADDMVARAAERIADQVIAFFSKPESADGQL